MFFLLLFLASKNTYLFRNRFIIMSCSICSHAGHNSATCTSHRVEDSARLLWTMFDFVEDQVKRIILNIIVLTIYLLLVYLETKPF